MSLVSWLFLIFAIVDSYVYIPMIRDLIRHPEETSRNINLQTWGWWSLSGFVYLTFFITEIGNGLAIFSSVMHLVGCLTVVGLVIRYRSKFAAKIEKNETDEGHFVYNLKPTF